jgi:hypothetical protein
MCVGESTLICTLEMGDAYFALWGKGFAGGLNSVFTVCKIQ